MKNRDLVMMAKARAAVDYILKTAPDMLTNKEAVEELRDALPAPVQPMRAEQKPLTTLVSEAE